jgi:uncharacterized membrane protein
VTAIAKVFSSMVHTESPDANFLRAIALFCCVGLLISVLVTAWLTYAPREPSSLDVLNWI